jgi:hypothetical protein
LVGGLPREGFARVRSAVAAAAVLGAVASLIGRSERHFGSPEARQYADRCICSKTVPCLKCGAPRKPVAELIERRPMVSGRTQMIGICSTCERLMHRFVANRNLQASLREFGVHSEPAEHPAEVIGQRDDHDLANQIRGRDPRAVVDARPCADSRSVFVERLVAVDAQRSS